MDQQNFQKAKELIAKYRLGECSEEESALVEQWYMELGSREPDLTDEELHNDLVKLQGRLAQISGSSVHTSERYAWLAAASILLLLVAGFAWYHFHPIKQPRTTEVAAVQVPPGTDRATLVLGDGNKIDLSSAPAGQLTSFAAKDSGNTLSYSRDLSSGKEASNTINTLITPKGGQYRLHLPDGSLVLLNAASSLSFPAAFAERKERRVMLKGEAWFEIKADPGAPFVVQTERQEVEVLGTRFNVNAYEDEPATVTTLEQGAVAVSADGKRQVLKPGQQTILVATNLKVEQADLETMLAWKNGQIRFRDATLQQVLRQVARWYDIDIEYQGPVNTELITGGVSRSSNLDAVLRILEISGIHFRAEFSRARKKLIILP